MCKLPAIDGWEAIRAFERAGFTIVRKKGSHYILRKKGWRYHLSIPVHKGKNLKKGLLRKQIKQAGLTEAEFVKLLWK
ncbi:MAG: type II toxin-antitoxin system HicA family toxin [Planctomycetes bacterium]|nr:type II toxin-antitoxin system HicA family toxin [Planctomycetota bacterium]